MLDTTTQEKVLMGLMRAGLLRQTHLLTPMELKPFKERGVVRALEGQATVAGKDVILCVGADRRFPLSLPKVFLRPWDALGFIPHIDQDGYVCYADGEGILLNTEDPVGIFVEATERTLRILEDGVSGKNRWDFMDEFQAYWRQVLPKEPTVLRAFVRVDGCVRKVYAYKDKDGYKFVSDGDRAVLAYFSGNPKALESLTQRSALYLPLRDGSFVLPPQPGKPWNLREVQYAVHENLTSENLRRLERLGHKWKSEELVLLGVPRPSGGVILVGLLFRGVDGGHPLLHGTIKDQPEPVAIRRHDAEYLMPRGGSPVVLHNTRALLAGCGSVGGYVALALAQMGIGALALVDPDTMQAENTFRHVLGRSALGKPKAMAVRAEIERKYPYVSVQAHEAYIEEAVQDGLVRLSDFDLVIIALGNPTVELYMNRMLHTDASGPVVVFAWLEPYGIGGHALLTRPGIPGCFHCLYTLGDDQVLWNRAAFAASGQFFGKDDLGCGSLYTPYGALDAQRTADLAVRLALDGLTGREPESSLLSWKGLDEGFRAAGFRISRRYGFTLDERHTLRHSHVRPDCPVCGGSGK